MLLWVCLLRWRRQRLWRQVRSGRRGASVLSVTASVTHTISPKQNRRIPLCLTFPGPPPTRRHESPPQREQRPRHEPARDGETSGRYLGDLGTAPVAYRPRKSNRRCLRKGNKHRRRKEVEHSAKPRHAFREDAPLSWQRSAAVPKLAIMRVMWQQVRQ